MRPTIPTTTTRCPYCRRRVYGVPAPTAAVLQMVVLELHCPKCERRWNEFRTAREVKRYWDRSV